MEITVDVVEEMPETRVGRKGKWTDLIDAALDGKPRRLSGIPEADMDAIRRQLSHTASSRGKGVTTAVKDGVLYFQVGDKRPNARGSTTPGTDSATVQGDGSSTPVTAAAPNATTEGAAASPAPAAQTAPAASGRGKK